MTDTPHSLLYADMKSTGKIMSALMIAFLWAGCNKEGDPDEILFAQPSVLIPLPSVVESKPGNFELNEGTQVEVGPLFSKAVMEIKNVVHDRLSVDLELNNGPVQHNFIRFVKKEGLNNEQYELSVSADGITIHASTVVGGYYAAQTLKQLLLLSPVNKDARSIAIQSIHILDEPKYSYRAFHLDVARHFFHKEYVKQILDWMAFYKMNKFHFHLTDDQGWRVQIDKYPLLTEVGSRRHLDRFDSACMTLALQDPMYKIDERFLEVNDGVITYQGFYSKDDIREIVSYAKDRFIEIIPEIDMPGHMFAAIRAYPALSCVGEAGIGNEFSFPICPCSPATMQFAFDVWDEIIDLFPSDTVHIGADEVEKDTWKASSECLAFMKENGFVQENEIQNYFVLQLQKHLEERGKKVIAWDDVIDGNVNQNLLMMYWRDYKPEAAEACASNGNSLIMTPWSWFYLSSKPNDQSLEDLYKFDASAHFSQNVINHTCGYQSCLWTEIIPSERAFEYYVFPRFQAFSELAWIGEKRDWNSFKNRLRIHLEYLTSRDVKFTKPSFMR
jgi:hexosaminidase